MSCRLQDGRFERVGDDATRTVDVRVIAATNRNLEQEVEGGRFRRDLFYRLSVFPMVLPPLRERPEDITELAGHFVQVAARRYGKPAPRVTVAAGRQFAAYGWPGNIRELQHVIERAVLLARGDVLRLDGILGQPLEAAHPASRPSPREAPVDVIPEAEWRRREHANLRAALKLAHGRIYGPDGAAELLGVKPTTLMSRLKALGLRDASRRRRRSRTG